jgi:hypothetical protein
MYDIHRETDSLVSRRPVMGPLHARARKENTTVSELVRQALRDRYLGDQEQRKAAMQRLVDIRKPGADDVDSVEEVRRLRRGSRLDRLRPR